MKFTYKLLSLGLAIACLSGCNAANTEIASSSAATATVDPATDSTEVPASNNVFTSAGDGLYVTTDSGIYIQWKPMFHHISRTPERCKRDRHEPT